MDDIVIAKYRDIFSDLTIDHEEANELIEFLSHLNPPPDKLLWLRATAFKTACEFLADDKESNVSLLRTINYIIHAIENTCMDVKEDVENTVTVVSYDEDALTAFYNGLLDELNIDFDENKELYEYFSESNHPQPDELVQTRALVFKVACDHLSEDDKEHNVALLRCLNVIIHAFERSCFTPKPFQLKLKEEEEEEAGIDYSGMGLSEAVQYLWKVDVNRLKFGDDLTINVGRGKKPFWKEDAADDPLFTSVDPLVWKRPTYKAFMALLDNYSAETGTEEVETSAERQEVWNFLYAVYETGPLQFCHRYCHAKNPDRVPGDKKAFLNLLHTIWFELYNRSRGGRADSSGFEHVFVGEVKDNEISGFHNWIQFYLEEKKGSLDYRGYIKPRGGGDEHDDDDYLLTLQFSWNGVEKFVGTSFLGVSPEFEFALYTMCFLVGEEENQVEISTGSDTFGVTIKCYRMAGNKIGTTYPEVTSHYED